MRRRSNFSKYFLIIMSFVFLGYLINAYIEKRETRQSGTSAVESVERCTRNDFMVSDIQWPKGSQDAVEMIDSITITNKGNYDCKDIKGMIRFLSNEGTELDKSNFIIPEKIRSKETKTFKSIPLEQHTSANADEASVTIVEATFYPEKGE
jgi:hypothetical protein